MNLNIIQYPICMKKRLETSKLYPWSLGIYVRSLKEGEEEEAEM